MSDVLPADLPEQVVFNMTLFGRIAGPRAGKYTQKTQTRVEIHEYPSGKEVTKALLVEDFDFFDKNKRRIRVFNESSLKRLHSMKVKWHIQKNLQNGQTLQIMVELDHPVICPVRNTF